MPMVKVSPNDTYRMANALIEKKNPRPISMIGGGRSGALIAFIQGSGGKTDE